MKCANCGNEKVDDLGEGKFYCPECDMSFASKKGRIEVAKKGRIDSLEDNVKSLKARIDTLTSPADEEEEIF